MVKDFSLFFWFVTIVVVVFVNVSVCGQWSLEHSGTVVLKQTLYMRRQLKEIAFQCSVYHWKQNKIKHKE